MTSLPPALLPEGFRDRLPEQAEAATHVARAMLDVLSSHGYERVAPAIAEFEETMSARSGAGSMRNRLLRFSDPVSGHTLAVRGDITVQIGRIASTTLAAAIRPLRLSYHGQVLRLRSAPLRPEREITQIGAELIGRDSVAAVAEMVSMAIEALTAAGVKNLIVDFTLPDLVEILADKALPLSRDQMDAVRSELDMKNAGGLVELGAEAYLPLLAATGPFDEAMAKLTAFDKKGVLKSRLEALSNIASSLSGQAILTLDSTERHGFEYQSWVGFTIFAEGFGAALGRGGTYKIANSDGDDESATGFSLYPDALIDAATTARENKRLFLPLGTDTAKAARLRSEGWVTIAALDESDDAASLNCMHVLSEGKATPAR
jgi:ATP phosphoribosyltransferase regulatory subunit